MACDSASALLVQLFKTAAAVGMKPLWRSALGLFRSGWRSFFLAVGPLVIHQVTQILAGFKVGYPFRRDLNARAGLWIAANTRVPLPCAKAAESADFDLIAGAQSSHNGIKDGLNDRLRVSARQIPQSHYVHYKIGFCHEQALSLSEYRMRAGVLRIDITTTYCHRK
jgi:hypothetical protein